MNPIMPPRWEKPGISLTVKTLVFSSAVNTSFRWFSSEELINTMRQSSASWGFEIRLAMTLLPPIVALDSVASKVCPNGSMPSTQISNDPPLSEALASGHSTNLPKL
jgi:hypothetical protein